MPAMRRTQYICKPLSPTVEVTVPPPRADAKIGGNTTRPVEVMPDGYVSDARPTAKHRSWTKPARAQRAVVYDASRSLPPSRDGERQQQQSP